MYQRSHIASYDAQQTNDVFDDLMDHDHCTAPARVEKRSSKTALFRMACARRLRGRRVRRIATFTCLVALMLALAGGSFHFLRSIYYLQQPDIQLGSVALKLDLKPRADCQSPMEVETLLDRASESFTLVDASVFKRSRKPIKKTAVTGIRSKTPGSVKPTPKPTPKDPLELLKEAGY